jgi:hypothetical protein
MRTGDRTLDRQLAYLGLLDDAAPLFREGSLIPCVGVLLAFPFSIESRLLQISRKLYGDVGPAFYGLRTTLLTLLLMALLRIKRAEHRKEKDPAAFGRLRARPCPGSEDAAARTCPPCCPPNCAEQLGAEVARVRVRFRVRRDRRAHDRQRTRTP